MAAGPGANLSCVCSAFCDEAWPGECGLAYLIYSWSGSGTVFTDDYLSLDMECLMIEKMVMV